MHFVSIVALDALVGLVIGLTGEGSGSLLTPLLIILARKSPAEAVGTSLAFGFTTKLYGSWSFFRRGLVRLELIKRLVPHRLRPGIERRAFFAGKKFEGLLILIGFVVGAVVSTTSIGSGALVISVLVILFPLRAGTLVGTSVVTGLVLIAVSSLPYAAMGNID